MEVFRRCLEGVLADQNCIDAHLGPDEDSSRNILYEDPELGFCILAHVYKGAKHSGPHDHGPSWAVYGQAKGITEMTEYRKVEPPKDGRPGKAEAVKTYALKPGMAAAYIVGRSEEHTSELQSLMRISYAVFCLKKKNRNTRK